MVEMAQNGLANYNSKRHLPSLISAQTTLGPHGTLNRLFEMEETYTIGWAKKSMLRVPQRAILVI
jgi:hypothetical protein